MAAANSTTLCRPPRGTGVRLGTDRVVLGEQHAEQDELRGLHVEDVVVKGMRTQLFGEAQEFRIDLAREREPRLGQRRQRPNMST